MLNDLKVESSTRRLIWIEEQDNSNLRSFLRNKIERKIFVKLSQFFIYHGIFRNIK